MTPTDVRTIPLSKLKVVILTLGAWTFVALGIWMLTWNDDVTKQLIGGLSVAFFGMIGLFGLWKLFDKKPGLTLNSAGLVDNTSAVAAGMVPWSDISGLSRFEMKQQQMVISVKDPERYIERGNAMVRAAKRANRSLCGSLVAISSHALKIDFDELQALLSQHRARYS